MTRHRNSVAIKCCSSVKQAESEQHERTASVDVLRKNRRRIIGAMIGALELHITNTTDHWTATITMSYDMIIINSILSSKLCWSVIIKFLSSSFESSQTIIVFCILSSCHGAVTGNNCRYENKNKIFRSKTWQDNLNKFCFFCKKTTSKQASKLNLF